MSFPVTVIQTLSAFVAGYLMVLVSIILIGFAGMMVYVAVIRAARHTRKARKSSLPAFGNSQRAFENTEHKNMTATQRWVPVLFCGSAFAFLPVETFPLASDSSSDPGRRDGCGIRRYLHHDPACLFTCRWESAAGRCARLGIFTRRMMGSERVLLWAGNPVP